MCKIDDNKSGEAFSASNLERLRISITSIAPVDSLTTPLLTKRKWAFLGFDTLKNVDQKQYNLVGRTELPNGSKKSKYHYTIGEQSSKKTEEALFI
jgi:hypothetical protein